MKPRETSPPPVPAAINNEAHAEEDRAGEPEVDAARAHELPAGLVLGRYSIVGLLARGGMAEIYLAMRLGEGAAGPVVIKRVLPHLPAKDNPQGMFADEAALSARLHHPNVAEVIEVITVDGSLFIVLEHLQGADTLEILKACDRKHRRVPFDVAVWVALGISAGLHYAHELRGDAGEALHVIHRDVSPQNLFITFDGDVKLLDFGLAKSIVRAAATRDGAAKGKLSYMSPEQVMTRPLDRRTDVFSLGICLWELTLGIKLYDTARGELAIVQEILETPPTAPRELDPDYPEALEAVVIKALAKRPEDRYPTAHAMGKALEAAAREAKLLPSGEAAKKFLAELYPDRAGLSPDAGVDAYARALANRHEEDERAATPSKPGRNLREAQRAILQTQRVEPLAALAVQEATRIEHRRRTRRMGAFFVGAALLVALGAALALLLR